MVIYKKCQLKKFEDLSPFITSNENYLLKIMEFRIRLQSNNLKENVATCEKIDKINYPQKAYLEDKKKEYHT